MRMGRLSQAAVPDLSRMFVDLCRRERTATLRMDITAHHALSDRLIDVSKEIKRRGEDGRQAILTLLDHDEENVRLWAASYVLELDPDLAPDAAVSLLEHLVIWGEQEANRELRQDVISLGLRAESMLYTWREKHELLTPEETLWLKPMSRSR